ncbi:Plasmodium exported protein, unknown function [Plasmodium gallinaceum]|uniref:Surface-associated interspersed protein (SURFIN) n=1 Tax=Plasmodium gallinaceum TaxID=5849 RepID=A0A1J1H3C1_PLAGA|nr:Plasmodium exported protein, unknown function [Plasmodium gallinaceum]CRG97982.1 Plasmodium exported protein, unknown function [Plasmodium gallinaceum]
MKRQSQIFNLPVSPNPSSDQNDTPLDLSLERQKPSPHMEVDSSPTKILFKKKICHQSTLCASQKDHHKTQYMPLDLSLKGYNSSPNVKDSIEKKIFDDDTSTDPQSIYHNTQNTTYGPPVENLYSTNVEGMSSYLENPKTENKNETYFTDLQNTSLPFLEKQRIPYDVDEPCASTSLKRKLKENTGDKSKKKKISEKRDDDKKKSRNSLMNYSHGGSSSSFNTIIPKIIFKIDPNYLTRINEDLKKINNDLFFKYNEFAHGFNKNIQKLQEVVDAELKVISLKDLSIFNSHFSKFYKEGSKLSNIYKFVLLFNHKINYQISNTHELHNRMECILDFIKNMKIDYHAFKRESEIMLIMKNITYNYSYNPPKILSYSKNAIQFTESLHNMEYLIDSTETSIISGNTSEQHSYMFKTKVLISIKRKILGSLNSYKQKYLRYLNLLNMSCELMEMENIFNFFYKYNMKCKNYIKNNLKSLDDKEAIQSLLDVYIKEEHEVSECHKKSREVFVSNITKEKKIDYFSGLQKKGDKFKILLSLYKTYMEIVKIVNFLNQINELLDIRKSLKGMNLPEKTTKSKNGKEGVLSHDMKLHLLAELSTKKSRVAEIAFNLRKSYEFNSSRLNIMNLRKLIMGVQLKMENVFLITDFLKSLFPEDMGNKGGDYEKSNLEANVFLTLFFLKKILEKSYINELK